MIGQNPLPFAQGTGNMLSGIQPYCPAGEETAAEASRVYVPSRESIAIC